MASRRRWTTLPSFDDRLTAELERAARPADPTGVLERVNRRRSRRASLRKVQAGLLAVAVLAATTAGFVALRHAFEGNRVSGSATELPANGRIVFSSDVQDGDRLTVHLFSMEPDISAPMQLTEGNSGNYSADVSPDGGTIAFTQNSYDSGEVVIATMSIDGGTPTQITDPRLGASNPTWSPDGTRIAFTGGRKQSQRIYVMNADGSDPHPITGDAIFLPEDPAWSPDGSLIAFRGSPTPPLAPEGPSAWDIYTVEPGGQNPANITDSPALESQPTWSRDSASIAYTYSNNLPDGPEFGIAVRRLSDGAETLLTDGPELDSDPVWSPDGRFIVFSRQPVMNGRFELWRIRAVGGAPTMLTVGGYGASWQPIPRTTVTPTPVTSPSPSLVPEDSDIGLGFNVCNLAVLSGIDFLGDGTDGTAWTATKVEPNGKCPSTYDGTNGVAVDFTGDGDADSWSETIEHCTVCGPFMARDLNEDGAEEVIITLQGGSIMQYGIYTVMPVDGRLRVVPFRTGEPGHDDAGHAVGQPFTFWVGGDEGSSYWFHCEALPEFRLTDTYTPVDGGPDAETTVHETHVSLGTDGIAHILDSQTHPVLGVVDLQYATSKPDCGLGVDVWRLEAGLAG
jgi:TolB protein